MSTQVRMIHVPSATALESVRARVRQALHTWACRWARGWLDNEQLPVSVCRASDLHQRPDGSNYEAVTTAAGSLWIRRSVAHCVRSGTAVVGERLMPNGTCADEWVSQAVQSAYQAFRRALYLALYNVEPSASIAAHAAIPESVVAFGAGAVHLACERLGLDAIVDGAVWRSLPPQRAAMQARPPLTPLYQAIRRNATRLDVVLGSVEVELPKLTDLRCGDLLRLPKRLDEALSVEFGGRPVAHAALGELLGQKSVQLMSQ
jgi:hypothetical protein